MWGSGQHTSLRSWVVWITAVTGVFRAPIHLPPRLPSSRLSGRGIDPCWGRVPGFGHHVGLNTACEQVLLISVKFPSFSSFLASFLSSKDSRPRPPLSVGYGFLPKHTLATGWGMSWVHRGPGHVVLCYCILWWLDSCFLENPVQGKVWEEACLRHPQPHPLPHHRGSFQLCHLKKTISFIYFWLCWAFVAARAFL